jgi:hypothetical protein
MAVSPGQRAALAGKNNDTVTGLVRPDVIDRHFD